MSEVKWEKMRAIIREEMKQNNPPPPPPAAKVEKVSSGDTHKTLLEMLECPNCLPDGDMPKVKHKLQHIVGLKECKGDECHYVQSNTAGECKNCGNDLD